VRRGPASAAVGAAIAVGVAVFALGLGATRDTPRTQRAAGDSDRGRTAIEDYGCGGCHTIPGVRGANATVGPPLTGWAQRSYIAGRLANTPANVARWVSAPQAVEPGTAMPDMGVSRAAARDIAAYLFRLR
jgi:cytochrome c